MQADGGIVCNEAVLMNKEVCCYVIVDSSIISYLAASVGVASSNFSLCT